MIIVDGDGRWAQDAGIREKGEGDVVMWSEF
jgi:hypothetical protein